MVAEKFEKNPISKPDGTFLGYRGIGARISIERQGNITFLKETTKSQMILLILIGLFVAGMIYPILFRIEEIKNKSFSIPLMLVGATIGSFGFIKYLLRYLQYHRVELNFDSKNILFIRKKIEYYRKISFTNLNSATMVESVFDQGEGNTPNYTVQLHDRFGKSYSVCCTNNKEDALAVLAELKRATGEK